MVPSGSIGNADAGVSALQLHCRQLFPAKIDDRADPLPKCYLGQAQARLGPRRLVALGMLHVPKPCIVSNHRCITLAADGRQSATEYGQNAVTVHHERFLVNGQGLLLLWSAIHPRPFKK